MKYDLTDIEQVNITFTNGSVESFIPKRIENDIVVDLDWSVKLKKKIKLITSNQTLLPTDYISKPYPNDK